MGLASAAVDLHEHQGKELLRRYGIPVSEGRLATTPAEARRAAEELGGPVVVKAQVLTGGRGRAGGVKLAAGPDEAEEHARAILGLDIRGHVVRRLLIERASEIEKEYYLSITFDRGARRPLLMLTREGGVTYVRLDGSVGILGNGAGLAMATVDLVVVAGGRPANFCDLGGGGRAEGVVAALEVITADPAVRSIFFNIFGGLTRCDEVARGILTALEQIEITVPIVVRLDGTNAEEGRRILADARLEQLHVEPTMLDAAKRAVELAA